jgi:hypothetical protein
LKKTNHIKLASAPDIGDILLSPIKWCNGKWDAIQIKDSQGASDKARQIALRIIPGALLTLATALALIPALFGRVAKACFAACKGNKPLECSEEWRIKIDGVLNFGAQKLRRAQPEEISQRVLLNLETLNIPCRAVNVRESDAGITINLKGDQNSCLEYAHIADETIKNLTSIIFGVLPSNRAQLIHSLQSNRQISFYIPKNSDEIIIRVYP